MDLITKKVLLILFLLQQNFTKEIRQVQRCPSKTERLRIHKPYNCSSNQVYHCLLDDGGLLKETCNEPIQLPAGKFPRYSSYSDRVYYSACPDDRYQPWPVKSYEITECVFLKSACNGLGEVILSPGNATKDAKCGCDFKSGYVPGESSLRVSPSVSIERYCYFKPCVGVDEEMNSDYQCLAKCPIGYLRTKGKNDCEIIFPTTRLQMGDATTLYAISTLNARNMEPLDNRNRTNTYFYIIGISVVFTLICLIGYLSKRRCERTGDQEKPIPHPIPSTAQVSIEDTKEKQERKITYDAILIYMEKDQEIALKFEKHHKEIVPDIKVKLIEDLIMPGQAVLDDTNGLFEIVRYVFILITEDFNMKKLFPYKVEKVLLESLQDDEKFSRVVPVNVLGPGCIPQKLSPIIDLKYYKYLSAKEKGKDDPTYINTVKNLVNSGRENYK